LTAGTVSIAMAGQTYSPQVVDGVFEQTVTFTAQQSYAIVVTATNEVGTSTSVQRNVIYNTTPPALSINPVSPTNQTSQVVTGTMGAGATVTVSCASATVDAVSYPTATTWSTTVSGFTAYTNDIAVTATDAAGNVANAATRIIYNTTPPTGSLTINGGAIVTNSTQVQLSLSATNADGVSQMQFSNDGTTWSAPEAFATMKAWALTDGDGPKQVFAQFMDSAGNWSAVSAGITLDTTPPVVIPAPVGGIYNVAQYAILTANEAATIYYTTDGTTPTIGSAVYSQPIAIPVNTTLKYFAKDSAGNLSETKTDNYVIDTVPPALNVSTLDNGSYTNNTALNIAGLVTDNVGVKGITINGTTVTVNADGSFSYALLLQSGANLITVTATDLAGNQTSNTRTVILDKTAPVLVVNSPADNSKTGQVLLTVSGTVDETSSVTVTLDDTVQPASMASGTFSAVVTLVPGYNTILMMATDLAGNMSTVKRTVIYDDQTPSLAVTVPNQDIWTNQGSLTIQGTASDPLTAVTVAVTMGNQTFTPPVVNGAFEQPVTFAAQQSYAIVITATNEVGATTSIQRNVIYSITPPALTINPVTSPTNQASQVVTGTREAGATVTVSCITATVGNVTYPTSTTWSADITNLTKGDNIVTVKATDQAGNITTASADIVYSADATFTFAVFGNKSVTMSGGSYTDSYLSYPPSITKGQCQGGSVGTNSLQSCSIQLSGGGTEIFGKALVGVGGNPVTGICATGGSLVYNNDDGTLVVAKDMTPKTDPGGGTSMGGLNLSGTTKTVFGGNYRYSAITLSGGSTLTLSGQITLHIDGNLTLSGGSKIVVTSGPVTVYANGQKVDISGGSIINNTQDPKMLAIFGTAGLTTANLSGGGTQHFLVYAPNAAITLSGGQNTFGSVIGNTVTLSGGSSVHFDQTSAN
jgi:hypothetical protein